MRVHVHFVGREAKWFRRLLVAQRLLFMGTGFLVGRTMDSGWANIATGLALVAVCTVVEIKERLLLRVLLVSRVLEQVADRFSSDLHAELDESGADRTESRPYN